VATPAVGERVQVRIPIESVTHAAGLLLRMVPEVEVLQPIALRRALLARAQEVAGLYAD
jgi:hypothetical protein